MNWCQAPFVGLLALLLGGCGTGPAGIAHVGVATQSALVTATRSVHQEKTWTREDVAALFVAPEEAGLAGGEVRNVEQGTASEIALCVPLNPANTPTVAADKRYSTVRQEITVPYKGRITQQGWVFPNDAEATAIMRLISAKLPRCRYSGTTSAPLEPASRISGNSDTHVYSRDAFGWHGHRIEQIMNVNGKRVSVSTLLLLQRGPVLLTLDYTNYTAKTAAQALRAYNMGILRKVLAPR